MSKKIGTTEIEATINSHAAVANAHTRSFARQDDGTLEVTLTIEPGDGDAPERVEADAPEPEPERDAAENAGIYRCKCGETADSLGEMQAHWGSASEGGHALAETPATDEPAGDPPESGDSDPEGGDPEGSRESAEPDTRAGYVRAHGPCLAAKGPESPKPCGSGAKDGDSRFCAMHANVSEPTLADDAVLAREAWKNGDSEVVTAFIEEYA